MNLKTVKGRYGKFHYASNDDLVGLSLEIYGEFSEFEVNVFRKTLREGETAIDVGANIGAFTVPMAQFVGKTGKVIAIEPGETNANILRSNVFANDLANVQVIEAAASDQLGTIPINYRNPSESYPKVGEAADAVKTVQRMRIDDLKLEDCAFIKIDVDGHEAEVLRGAENTIKRCQPMIYIENELPDKSGPLISQLVDYGYRLYWYRPPLFNPENFTKNKRNIFQNMISLMMICVPEESKIEIEGCDEVTDFRPDDLMFDREIERLTKRLERKPNIETRLMVAHYHKLMQHDDKAWALMEENLRENPNHVASRAIKGLWRLQSGDWSAWKDYELRYEKNKGKWFGGDRYTDKPKWQGEETEETVLIWSEQGFGDSIMFARFMDNVFQRAPNAILEVQPQLYELFANSFVAPNALYRKGRKLPAFTLHCSLPSTASRLNADVAMISELNGGYLQADPEMVKNWKGRSYPRIGLCSNGSPMSERPYTRDIPFKLLNGIMRKYGPVMELQNTGQFESFMDTAACISALDLVITVDTSVAHLAGALGVPTWLLLSFDPDFRWGLKGDSTIWYKSIKIFRQPKFRDWASVVEQLDHELSQSDVMRQAAE